MYSDYVRLVKPLTISDLEDRIRYIEMVASEWDTSPDMILDSDGNHYNTLIREYNIQCDERAAILALEEGAY